ncbi:MAG TPA: CDP-diacylglycerol--serine O-phosphatidyltransferase [Gemmatimonadaceae bacterium]|nr:CDP-diacylglycerol--serine O-phosphatidyltransferase [Gemmatimonadaceae bacterium]
MRRPRLARASMVMLPNGFTLASLFFGVFSIVAASRGDHERAVWYILISGICDATDGRVARATRTESRFGEELDSLVDALSFGLAPALLMYFAVLRKDGWDWVFVFLFVACAVMRLARFNVEQAGRLKSSFRGLPSPAAGGTLATYLWFSQTPLYNQTLIGDLPWHTMVRFMMAGLGFLMISNVPYPTWPTFSTKTWRGVVGLLLFIALASGLFLLPKEFFFPVGMLYVVFGLVAAVVRGLLDRQELGNGELGADDDAFEFAHGSFENGSHVQDQQHRPRQRRRGPRGAPTPPGPPGPTMPEDRSE